MNIYVYINKLLFLKHVGSRLRNLDVPLPFNYYSLKNQDVNRILFNTIIRSSDLIHISPVVPITLL